MSPPTWAVAVLSLLPAVPAGAATIEARSGSNGAIAIVLDGQMFPGDGDRFAAVANRTGAADVVLTSDGGDLGSGLQIGSVIRQKKWRTVVLADHRCASACALAWLGGTRRFMGRNALVGFHAAYTVEKGMPSETGAGNALVGAYLNRLGLSDQAVVYITSAAPRQMNWLTSQAARSLGIEVTVMADTSFLPGSSSASAPAVVPVAPATGAAGAFRLFNRGSQPVIRVAARPQGGEGWLVNRMLHGPVVPGGDTSFGLPPGGQCVFDLRVTFADGQTREKHGADLCAAPDQGVQ